MADIAFTGSLADEPEVFSVPNGSQVTRLRVTEKEAPRRADGGEWEGAVPASFRVHVWGTLGENAATSLRKGQSVNVAGYTVTSHWPDKETGKTRATTIVMAETVGPDLTWQTARVAKAPKKSPGAAGVPGATDDGAPDEPQKQIPHAGRPRSRFTSSVTPSEEREDEELEF